MPEECKECRKKWADCPGFEFYTPAEIRFCPHQVTWLIGQLALLRVGSRPSDQKETGYTGSKGKVSQKAYFETPVSVAAELDWRLERCGLDGILLEFVYAADIDDRLASIAHIASALRLDPRAVERRINTALRYVSGRWRRTRSYRQFVRHK